MISLSVIMPPRCGDEKTVDIAAVRYCFVAVNDPVPAGHVPAANAVKLPVMVVPLMLAITSIIWLVPPQSVGSLGGCDHFSEFPSIE
jgi:hypothetical protein